jgi:cytochrome P450
VIHLHVRTFCSLLPDYALILVRANAATSSSQALTHSEMLSQISTFLAAGHETTASALTWTLYALARAPAAQTRLRAALRACDTSDFDTVLNLPLLEYTVREALRLHAPVSGTLRVYAGAAPECFVPLQNRIRVRVPTWRRLFRWFRCRSQFVARLKQRMTNGICNPVSISVTATSSTSRFRPSTAQRIVWGTDAGVFRPERWAALPPAVCTIPGLYAHTLTFLNGNGGAGGNRSCIGYRFALAEIKVFLACLLHDLEFSIDDDVVIEKRVK